MCRCNAVSYSGGVCEEAALAFLEDPDVGDSPKDFLLRSEVRPGVS